MNADAQKHTRAILKNVLRLVLIIAAAFLINAVILLLLGKDVGEVYRTLFTGAFVGKWNFRPHSALDKPAPSDWPGRQRSAFAAAYSIWESMVSSIWVPLPPPG